MNVTLRQQAEIIGALELGILPKGNINELLKTLTSEEAHIAKRKFRKLKRKLIKKSRLDKSSITASDQRWLVLQHCRKVGMDILTK